MFNRHIRPNTNKIKNGPVSINNKGYARQIVKSAPQHFMFNTLYTPVVYPNKQPARKNFLTNSQNSQVHSEVNKTPSLYYSITYFNDFVQIRNKEIIVIPVNTTYNMNKTTGGLKTIHLVLHAKATHLYTSRFCTLY